MNQHQTLVKNELMKAFRIEQDINNKMEQIVSLRELATKASNVLSDMPGSPNRNIHKTEDIIVKFIGMEEELKKEITSLLGTKQYVKDLISQVTDREGRIILEQRYLQYDKWEEIAGEMGYTVRQIFRIHDAALMEIGISESCHEMS